MIPFLFLTLIVVIPRNDWINRQPVVRPQQYIVIDSLGACFDEAIARIVSEEEIGVAVTGVDIGRKGKLCWIQVCGIMNKWSWLV